LAWFDRLLDFRVRVVRRQASIGYAAMPVNLVCEQISHAVVGVVEEAEGTIRLDGWLGDIAVSELLNLSVSLVNASRQTWVGTYQFPLSVCSRWEDTTQMPILAVERRYPLSGTEIRPGQAMPLSIQVQAPSKPGRYRLELQPEQEGYACFDQYGFTPAVLDLVVQPLDAARRYPGADMRLRTQSGKRQGTILVATGQAGLDVACSQGAEVLAKLDFCSGSPSNTTVSLSFELSATCGDLEIRFWVPANVRALIEALVIEPV
jgi:hypothetical protein